MSPVPSIDPFNRSLALGKVVGDADGALAAPKVAENGVESGGLDRVCVAVHVLLAKCTVLCRPTY